MRTQLAAAVTSLLLAGLVQAADNRPAAQAQAAAPAGSSATQSSAGAGGPPPRPGVAASGGVASGTEAAASQRAGDKKKGTCKPVQAPSGGGTSQDCDGRAVASPASGTAELHQQGVVHRDLATRAASGSPPGAAAATPSSAVAPVRSPRDASSGQASGKRSAVACGPGDDDCDRHDDRPKPACADGTAACSSQR